MRKIDFSQVVEKVVDELQADVVDSDRYPVSIPEVKHLRGEKGLTYEQIGKIFGVTKQAIHTVCKKYGIEKEGITKYKDKRLSNLLHLEEKLFDLTVDDINSIKPGNRIVNGAIVFDKVQLESLRPTQVTAYVDILAGFQELEKQRQAEIDKLGYDPADVVDGEVVEDEA